MPSHATTTDRITPGDCLRRLAVVVRGKSFRESDKPKDRISGRSLLAIVERLCELAREGVTDPTAEQLAGVWSVRVVRRVLAFLRSEGLIEERAFRRHDSPRVERSLNWPRLVAWIEQQATLTEKDSESDVRTNHAAPAPRVSTQAGPHPRTPQRRADAVPAVPPQKQSLVPSPVRDCNRHQHTPEDQTQVMAIKAQLNTLGVYPLAVDQAAVSLETVRRLVDHYTASGLAREDGSLCYAWSPGLLFKRITDEALAFRSPTDWPQSKDEEWRKLKARAVNAARLAREETVRQMAPEIDKRARLHQLEMRFADLLKDPALIIERLLQLPDPNTFLIKRIRTNGINSDGMKLLVLSAIERHEQAQGLGAMA